jgi:type IV pilus assembly protein PilB
MEEIGFTKDNQAIFTEIIRRPYGIILVTGPTGSGKTTTLYAALQTINTKERNIVTIEDPVEYELPGVQQSQVNPKAGLVFANALRALLRQDPDVMLVGEIRDLETAGVAIESALTGHLVFSTLHTNDAAGALTRLEDMGVEPFLISSAAAGIIAQRLVRRICTNCKEEEKVPDEILEKFNLGKSKQVFYHGKGCKNCRNTGYRGRLAIFEILLMNDKIREMIIGKSSSAAIKQAAIEAGMITLRDDGIRKALNGLTTLEEVMRVTQID